MADAELRARGVTIEGRSIPLPGQADETELAILEDASLAHRPQVRRLMRFLSDHPLTNLDGTPLKGSNGQPLQGSMWELFLRHGMIRAMNGDQVWEDRIWTTYYGKPREAMELSGPSGGPIETHNRNENLNVNLSADEVQANLREMAETIRLAREARDGVTQVPTAIDVKAELIAESQADAEAGIIPIAGKAS